MAVTHGIARGEIPSRTGPFAPPALHAFTRDGREIRRADKNSPQQSVISMQVSRRPPLKHVPCGSSISLSDGAARPRLRAIGAGHARPDARNQAEAMLRQRGGAQDAFAETRHAIMSAARSSRIRQETPA